MATADRRIQVSRILGGAGALLLLISLFLDWFEPGVSAWTVFEALDLLLAATAVAALTVAALPSPRGGVRGGFVAASTLPVVVVASQRLNTPPAAQGRAVEPGAWLALVGAGAMTAGAVMSVTGISLAVVVERRQATGPVRSAEARPASEQADRRHAPQQAERWWEDDR